VITIEPHDGFAILLPYEAKTFDVIFRPTSAITYDVTLLIKTSMTRSYKVRVRGQGVQSLVTISHSVIKMASACGGDIISHDVMVTNNTKQVSSPTIHD